jgi:hypothetical protein
VFYTPLRGDNAKFVVRNREGKKLTEVSGKAKYLRFYEVVAVNGTTEIIGTKKGEIVDHKLIGPRFYFVDDPAMRTEILTGEFPACPKNERESNNMSQNKEGGPCVITQK